VTQSATNLRIAATGDGAILLDLARGKFFRVNPMGSKIVQILQQGNSVSNVIEQISLESGTDIDIVRMDVEEFVHLLRGRGLLESLGPVKSGDGQ
jgi:Coenzyme PQQ synthesis protein D (PqqD)